MMAILVPVLLSPVLVFAKDIGDDEVSNLAASEDPGVPGTIPVSVATTSTPVTQPSFVSPTSTIPPESGYVTVVPTTPVDRSVATPQTTVDTPNSTVTPGSNGEHLNGSTTQTTILHPQINQVNTNDPNLTSTATTKPCPEAVCAGNSDIVGDPWRIKVTEEQTSEQLDVLTKDIESNPTLRAEAKGYCPKQYAQPQATQNRDGYHYRDCLALWRWQKLSIHFPAGRGMFSAVKDFTSEYIGMVTALSFAVPSFVWKMIAWIIKSADVDTTWLSVREAVNEIFIAVRGTADHFLGLFVLVAVVFVLFKLLRGPAKEAAVGGYRKGSLKSSFGAKNLLNTILMIAVPAAVFLWLTGAALADRDLIEQHKSSVQASEGEADAAPAAFMSPWWMQSTAQQATGTVLGLVTLASSDSFSPARLGRVDTHQGYAHATSCVNYEEKLEAAARAAAHSDDARPGATTGYPIASGMSKLYKILVIRAWERAQFGPSGLGTAAGCRFLERYAGVDPVQQYRIDTWTGTTSSGMDTWPALEGARETNKETVLRSYLAPSDPRIVVSNKMIHHLVMGTIGGKVTGDTFEYNLDPVEDKWAWWCVATEESWAGLQDTTPHEGGVANWFKNAGSAALSRVTFGLVNPAAENKTPYYFDMNPRPPGTGEGEAQRCINDLQSKTPAGERFEYHRYVDAFSAFRTLIIDGQQIAALSAVLTSWIASGVILYAFAGILIGYAVSTLFLTITILLIPVAVVLWSIESRRQDGIAMFWWVGVAAFSKVLCVLLIEIALLLINLFYSVGVFRSPWLAPLVPLVVVLIMRKVLKKAGVGDIMSLRNGALMTVAVAKQSKVASDALPAKLNKINFDKSWSSQKASQAAAASAGAAKGATEGFVAGGWGGAALGAQQGARSANQKWKAKQQNLSSKSDSKEDKSDGKGRFRHAREALSAGAATWISGKAEGLTKTEKFRGAVSAASKSFNHRKGVRYTGIPDGVIGSDGNITDVGLSHVTGRESPAAPKAAAVLTAEWDEKNNAQDFLQELPNNPDRIKLARQARKSLIADIMEPVVKQTEKAQQIWSATMGKAESDWLAHIGSLGLGATVAPKVAETFDRFSKAENRLQEKLVKEMTQRKEAAEGDQKVLQAAQDWYENALVAGKEKLGQNRDETLTSLGVGDRALRTLVAGHNSLESTRITADARLTAARAAEEDQREAVNRQYGNKLAGDASVGDVEKWLQAQPEELKTEMFDIYRSRHHDQLADQADAQQQQHRDQMAAYQKEMEALRQIVSETQNLTIAQTARYWLNKAKISEKALSILGDARAPDMDTYNQLSPKVQADVIEAWEQNVRQTQSDAEAVRKFVKRQTRRS